MKTSRILGLLCAATLVLGASPGISQTNDATGQPQGGRGFDKPRNKHQGPRGEGANLTPDEAQRLRAAREKAKDNPTIKSLREARDTIDSQLENAMDAAVLAADATLAPVLEKVKAARSRAKENFGRFESMTPDQKQSLKAAREAAKDDPAVVTAREKMKSAQDPQAKREAAREFHEAMKAAMTKQNPALAPLLEKLGPPPPPHGGHGGPGGPGGRGGPGGPGGDVDGPPPPPEGVDD